MMELVLIAAFIFSDFCLGVEIQQPSSVFVRAGEPSVTLTCNQDNSQFYYMFWYRQRAGTSGMELLVYSVGAGTASVEAPFNSSKYSATRPTVLESSLQMQPVEAADAAVYFCASSRADRAYNEAYFGAGTKLTVLDPTLKVTPPTVRVLEPSENEHKNQQKTLVCVASDFYPDHVSVSWTINDESVTEGVATDGDAVRNSSKGFYRITSRLTVPSNTWFSKSKFSCTVSFFDGTKTTDHPETITSKEKAIPSGTELSRDKYLWITQSAKLSYIIFIAKSCVYGVFIWFVAWKLQSSREKRGK